MNFDFLKSGNSKDVSFVTSYQSFVEISPNWEEIIKYCFPELKNGADPLGFVHSLFADKELEIDQNDSLFFKSFRFVNTCDFVSGLTTVWSDYSKTFVNKAEIIYPIFGFNTKIFDRFPNSYIWRELHITPDLIGFSSDLPDEAVADKYVLTKIPYVEIFNLLMSLENNVSISSMNMIKKFPESLQTLLDQNHVRYDGTMFKDYGWHVPSEEIIDSPWLRNNSIEIFNQTMKYHIFKSAYYNLYVKVKFFRPCN